MDKHRTQTALTESTSNLGTVFGPFALGFDQNQPQPEAKPAPGHVIRGVGVIVPPLTTSKSAALTRLWASYRTGYKWGYTGPE